VWFFDFVIKLSSQAAKNGTDQPPFIATCSLSCLTSWNMGINIYSTGNIWERTLYKVCILRVFITIPEAIGTLTPDIS
jgi:hypothetical protein